MFPVIKYWVRREKIKFLYKSETTAYWKRFPVKSDKKQKTLFCTPKFSKFQEILTLNIGDGAKQIYPKKQKKDPKKSYSTNFSSSHRDV